MQTYILLTQKRTPPGAWAGPGPGQGRVPGPNWGCSFLCKVYMFAYIWICIGIFLCTRFIITYIYIYSIVYKLFARLRGGRFAGIHFQNMFLKKWTSLFIIFSQYFHNIFTFSGILYFLCSQYVNDITRLDRSPMTIHKS